MSKWSDLSDNLVIEVASRLSFYEDFLALRGVCKPWRLATTADNFITKLPQLPLLMLPPGSSTNSYRFSDLSGAKTHQRIRPKRPPPGKLFSSQGWLVVVNCPKVELFNPFNGDAVQLPLLKQDRRVAKAVLSANPYSTSEYVVMLVLEPEIYQRVAYYVWQPTELDWFQGVVSNGIYRIYDVVFYQENFVLIDLLKFLLSWNAARQQVEFCRQMIKKTRKMYMAESDGGLVAVCWTVDTDDGSSFHVFEVDFEREEWIEVDTLGHKALFLAEESSAAMWVRVDERDVGLRANRIYFAYSGREKKIGIYNMAEKCFEPPPQGIVSGDTDGQLLWIFRPNNPCGWNQQFFRSGFQRMSQQSIVSPRLGTYPLRASKSLVLSTGLLPLWKALFWKSTFEAQ